MCRHHFSRDLPVWEARLHTVPTKKLIQCRTHIITAVLLWLKCRSHFSKHFCCLRVVSSHFSSSTVSVLAVLELLKSMGYALPVIVYRTRPRNDISFIDGALDFLLLLGWGHSTQLWESFLHEWYWKFRYCVSKWRATCSWRFPFRSALWKKTRVLTYLWRIVLAFVWLLTDLTSIKELVPFKTKIVLPTNLDETS